MAVVAGVAVENAVVEEEEAATTRGPETGSARLAATTASPAASSATDARRLSPMVLVPAVLVVPWVGTVTVAVGADTTVAEVATVEVGVEVEATVEVAAAATTAGPVTGEHGQQGLRVPPTRSLDSCRRIRLFLQCSARTLPASNYKRAKALVASLPQLFFY